MKVLLRPASALGHVRSSRFFMLNVAITRIGQLWIEYLVGGLIDDVRELPCRPFERQGCSLVRRQPSTQRLLTPFVNRS